MKHNYECHWLTETIGKTTIQFTFENHIGALAFHYQMRNHRTGLISPEVVYGVTKQQGRALLDKWNGKFSAWHYTEMIEMEVMVSDKEKTA